MSETYTLQEGDLEPFKLLFDFLKHLTTLSSGSILLVVTLFEKFFVTSPFRNSIVFALFMFGAAILLALMPMLSIPFHVGVGSITKTSRNLFATGVAFSGATFLVGMATMIYAVFRQYS